MVDLSKIPLPPLPAYAAPEVGMYANHQMREYALADRRAVALAVLEAAAQIADVTCDCAPHDTAGEIRALGKDL